MLKKLFLLTILSGLLVVSLSGIGFAEEKMVWGISMPTMTHPIREAQVAGINDWLEDHPNIEIIVTDGRLDSQKQVSDIEDLIVRGVDMLFVAANQSPTLTNVLRKANDQGIPVVAFDRTLSKPEQGITFVGSDDVLFGESCANYLVDQLDGKGKVVIIQGVPGAAVAQKRQDGFMSVIEKYPDIEVVSDQVGNFQRVQAVTIMENVLQAHPDIDAVYCHNDEMALGVVGVLERNNIDDVVVIGIDGQKDAIKSIMDGGMSYTVKKLVEFPKAADLAWDYLQGKEIEDEYILPTLGISIENAEEEYDPDAIF